jgi:hypothetical protein
MKNINFLFMMLAISLASFSQTASVTFNLNMELEEVSDGGVYLAGGADFGAPGDNPMTDEDGDGVYSVTIEVNTPYTGNYTFTNGNCPDWSCKENIAGQDCADGTWNDRLLSNITEDTVINTCFAQCTTDGSCFVAENAYVVTFNVNMSNETVAETGVFLAGGASFGVAGDNEMLDEDGDGTYSISLMLDEGLQSHYTFLNGNCGDWSCKENLADLPCGDAAAYNDRFLPAVTGPTTISTCFGQCSTDGTCEAGAEGAMVTFNVDMNEYTGEFGMVNLNGTFNGWCGECNPMTDEDEDGVYTTTLELDLGASIEYKFTLDGWTNQEQFAGGESCTVTAGGFTNRALEVSGDEVLDAVCFNSCEACGSATETVAVTFQVDMNEYLGAYAVVNLNGSFNGWCGGCNEMLDDDADGIYDITIDLNPESSYEYKFTLDGWANQEDFEEGTECTVTIDGFTNRSMTTGTEDESLALVCYNSCAACLGVEPETAMVTFNVDMSNEEVAESGVFIAGGAYFGAPGNYPMTDEDGDGVYTTVLELPTPFTDFYIFTNGECGDYSCKENLSGQECAEGTWNDRLLTDITEDTTITFCFGECSESCSAAGTALVTWNVNMQNEEVSPQGVFLAGGVDFGAPGDNPMTDEDGDGVYSITLELPTPYNGNYTFTNGACGDWSCKENIAGQDCADGTWNDRVLTNITEDHVVNTCFSECSTDGSCTPAVDMLFSIDMSNYAYLLDTDYSAVVINGSWNGWNGWGVELVYNWNNGRFEGTLTLPQGTIFEYVIAATGEADGWSGWGYTIHAPYQCSPNWIPGGPTENLNYGGFAQEGVIELCAGACVAVCPISGCTDPAYAEFALAATEDDGSCVTPVAYGCIYEAADNYDAEANTDNGTCIFAENDCPGDLDGDGLIATPDLLTFLSVFGTTCGE